jgi:hypothetical protein
MYTGVGDFPQNRAPNDKFRCLFNGTSIDQWHWRNYNDHQDTLVWSDDKGSHRQDNEGRLFKLVVLASNWFEFTLLEGYIC